jgi:sugar/nucleoside kinase (ribokinase family)
MVDVVTSALPQPGARLHADVTVRVGGSAVNAAAAAAAEGVAVTVVGRIGADATGDLVLVDLAARGIGTALARDHETPTGVALAFPSESSQPTVLATRGANARFAVDDVPGAIDADALYVSGFALFQSGSSDAAAAAIDRFSGAQLGIDVGSQALARVARDARLPTGTVLFATADEARVLTGAEPDEAARRLATRVAVACVKLGRDGAIAATRQRLERRRARSDAPSTFGSGDAFAGALLAALVRGDDLGAALERACEAGAAAAAG